MLALLSLAAALAQSVNVNVMPLRDVLPPQVMYYLSNPGQYFNITVQNPSTEAQQIFFGAELRQVTPASGPTPTSVWAMSCPITGSCPRYPRR